MLARIIAVGLLLLGMIAAARSANAQNDWPPEKEKTLVERLDNFGKSIFGGILPGDKSSKAKPRATGTKTSGAEAADFSPTGGRRAGSVLDGSQSRRTTPIAAPAERDVGKAPAQTSPEDVPRTTDGYPKTIRRPLAGRSLLDESGISNDGSSQSPVTSPSDAGGARSSLQVAPVETAVPKRPAVPPVYRRLSAARESVFDAHANEEPAAESLTEHSAVNPPTMQPATVAQPTVVGQATIQPAAELPAPAERATDTPPIKSNRASEPLTSPPSSPKQAKPKPALLVAQRDGPGMDFSYAPSAGPAVGSALPAYAAPSTRQVPSAEKPVELVGAMTRPRPNADMDVLVARKSPVISVETLGPRKIAIGRESSYEVNIVNSGEVAAEDMVVFISLPQWAEVAGAQANAGTVAAATDGQVAGTLQWKLGHLDAKGRQRLALRVVPRQNRSLDLAVRWEYKPVASQAMIEVQESKLTLQLEGPREVLFGKKEIYRLRLSNTGNGPAENVAVMLMPIGGGDNVPATHKLGMLPAGEEKTLEVELTARQGGDLTIQVDARADGGVRAELAEKVVVRRASLTADVEGPKVQFVGATATYAVRVRNPGTAPARNVRLSISLPAGSRYLSGIEGARLDAMANRLDWTVESLGPEVEQRFAVRCTLGSAGTSRVQLSAMAEDDLTTNAATVTRVEAVANLVMEVIDPAGPVAVGDAATYEVHVRNRGTKEAASVEVLAYFSRGIEPFAAEGAPNRVAPGQVTFQPIASLAPGAEAVLRIRARAETAGNHTFRAEAHCKPLGARLIREANNLYYADASTAPQNAPSTAPVANAMRPISANPQVHPRQ